MQGMDSFTAEIATHSWPEMQVLAAIDWKAI